MKMKKLIFIFAVLVVALGCCQRVSAQVGTWKNYLAYSEIQDVKRGGNMLYVLASNDLYTYNENDNSITTYDKVNGLNDCNISRIGWNNVAKKLIIVYSDYNIDLLDANGNITNISDYYNASVSGNKDVYSIFMDDRYAYLSTGFGIVKINMRDADVSDTYNLRFRVDYSYIDGNYIYAASSTNGLYRADLSSNLLDPNQWSRVGGYTARNYTVDPELMAEAKSLKLDGSRYNYFVQLLYKYGNLYSVGGGFNSGDDGRIGIVQVLNPSTGNWTLYEDSISQKTGYRYLSTLCLDVDPTDHNHVMVGARTGLFEFQNGRFSQMWNQDNGGLEFARGTSINYTLITGGAFDNNGNFWFGNSQASTQDLWEYTNDGRLVNSYKDEFFDHNRNFSLANMCSFMFDRNNNLWFVSNNWTKAAVCFYQPSTNGAYTYSTFINEDGTELSSLSTRCVTEDLNGNIWIGTSVGPIYIPYSDIGTSPDNMIFQQYKVPRNDGTDLADYLLSQVDIRSIAVDGANRKWFGTSGNGVYLISADNNTEIHHFLSSNSGLLSDNVLSIAINPTTGEVYFATDKGLCSYMSDASATVDKMSKDVTYAYPNPVRPDYTGPITITGLTYNADVKIVTSNGVLVAQGRSNGGSFIWDGNDLNGKRVASGVYMVQTATASGDKGTVCKIAVVN